MIKRIIFDFDGTLVPFRDEYYKTLYDFYEPYLKGDKEKAFFKLMNYIENNIKYYNKESFIKIVEGYLDIKIDDKLYQSFIDIMINLYKEEDRSIEPLLKYLSSKYELVILTNWLKEVQIGKLKKLGLDKYISKIYSCDTYLVKPNKEAFEHAVGNLKYSECVMVGDDFKIDIKPANELGMTTYFLTDQDVELDNNICIKNINNLKEFL